jgi:hypothetical protein
MAQRGVPAGWDSPADRPSVLQITVESDSRPRATVRRPYVVIALAVVVATAAAIAATIVIAVRPGGGGGSAPSTPAPHTPAPQQPVVLVQSGPPSALAPGLYRFPVGCPYSRVTAVERNRAGPCTPHNGYVAAVVRRTGGVWRVTLVPISTASCSPVPVPPLARGKVKACRR